MAVDRQTDIHTHNFRNAVMLVWGSLRLAPIMCTCKQRKFSPFPTLRADKNTVGVYADMMHTGSSRIFSLLTLCIRNIDNIKNMV